MRTKQEDLFMTFKTWILSDYTNNPEVKGAWGIAHILVLVSCALLCVGLAFFRLAKPKARRIVSITLASLILFFELARRIINLYKMQSTDFGTMAELTDHLLWVLLPRPWCAISCWLTIASVVVNKKTLYNTAAMCSLLCAIIFFSYPRSGIHKQVLSF